MTVGGCDPPVVSGAVGERRAARDRIALGRARLGPAIEDLVREARIGGDLHVVGGLTGAVGGGVAPGQCAAVGPGATGRRRDGRDRLAVGDQERRNVAAALF